MSGRRPFRFRGWSRPRTFADMDIEPDPGVRTDGFARWMFGARPSDHAVLRWLEWAAFRLAMILLVVRIYLGPGPVRDVLAFAYRLSSLLAPCLPEQSPGPSETPATTRAHNAKQPV
jgi:hypothetical protein